MRQWRRLEGGDLTKHDRSWGGRWPQGKEESGEVLQMGGERVENEREPSSSKEAVSVPFPNTGNRRDGKKDAPLCVKCPASGPVGHVGSWAWAGTTRKSGPEIPTLGSRQPLERN